MSVNDRDEGLERAWALLEPPVKQAMLETGLTNTTLALVSLAVICHKHCLELQGTEFDDEQRHRWFMELAEVGSHQWELSPEILARFEKSISELN